MLVITSEIPRADTLSIFCCITLIVLTYKNYPNVILINCQHIFLNFLTWKPISKNTPAVSHKLYHCIPWILAYCCRYLFLIASASLSVPCNGKSSTLLTITNYQNFLQSVFNKKNPPFSKLYFLTLNHFMFYSIQFSSYPHSA